MKVAQRLRFWTSLMVVCSLLTVAALAACGGLSTSRENSDVPEPTTSYSTANPAAPAAAPAAAGGSTASQAQGTTNITLPDQSKVVIKTGTLSLVVKDVDSAVAQIRGIALRYQGDLTQYSNSKTGDTRIGDVIIQVNGASFEDAMRELRSFEGVIDRKVDKADSKDVTEEYVDVKAQIDNLEATAAQLRALLPKATNTNDTLAIQREVNNVQSQIDRLKARKNYLDSHSAMSTITLHLETPATAAALDPDWRFSDVVTRAWAASLRALQAIATVAVTLVVFFWWLLPVVALGVLALRRYRRRRPAPSAPAAPPAPPLTPPTPPAATTGD